MKNSAFTLIELIIVIVLLGILAANALPRFVDFSDDALVNRYKNMAGTMTTSIKLMHNKWRIDGSPTGNYSFANAVYEMSAEGYPTGAPSCGAGGHDCRCVWWRFVETSEPTLGAASSLPGQSNQCGPSGAPYSMNCEFAVISSNNNKCVYRSSNGAADGEHLFTYDTTTGSVTYSAGP